MSKINFEYPKFHIDDDDGNPLSGGKVFFYVAGTSTLKATYTDYSGAVQNSNPVTLDSRGEADVFLDEGAYKIVAKDQDDVTIFTRDNYESIIKDILDVYQPGKNYILNPEGLINQRGNSGSVSTNGYMHDMWYHTSGGGTSNISCTDGVWTIISDASNAIAMEQKNDDILDLPDGTLLTFMVTVSSGTLRPMHIGLPGDSLTAGTYSIDFTLDKTVGDGWLYLYVPANTIAVFSDIAIVKRGKLPVPRTIGQEELLCQAYLKKIGEYNFGSAWLETTSVYCSIDTGVDMKGSYHDISGTMSFIDSSSFDNVSLSSSTLDST